jgi:predicted chitinase
MALFLARMQDLCPAFRRHLFAISSVSGGSVGAAVFAAALSSAAKSPATSESKAPQPPCGNKIAGFVANLGVVDPDHPGPLEERVDRTLSSDFLSPIVAASLFANFTQYFIPFPISTFDRARALEYTLENADRDSAKQISTANLLRRDYQSIWTPENGLPALLINTTDSGSGKRVLIAPFDINPAHPKDDPLCMLANVQRSADGIDVIASRSLHFPLSTAAFMSARFPWVTPAATVDISNSCITQKSKARLVDGGYIDNSGVESAINLIEAINNEADAIRNTTPDGIPKFRVYLISLSAGNFPDRVSFSFDDLLEPIRALLNGRSSRAYGALNSASENLKNLNITKASNGRSHFDAFMQTDLKNYFYKMPLGWIMSDKTREIVSIGSGRFWDCEPDAKYSQRRKFLSNADCIQLQVYHLLNGSVSSAIESEKYQANITAEVDKHFVGISDEQANHEKLLDCYENKWFHERSYEEYEKRVRGTKNATADNPPPYRQSNLAFYQSEQVRALLDEWDRRKDSDSRIFAYLLGSISYDSGDFIRTTENLSFQNATQIEELWPSTIKKINEYRQNLSPPLPPLDTQSLVNNPVALANTMWGWANNKFGNREVNDGYRYRPRGLYQIIGREQYERENQALKNFDHNLKLDILEAPNSVSNRRLSAEIALSHFYERREYNNKTLMEIIKEWAPDWKKIRTQQRDMDQGDRALKEVPQRTTMFAKCIDEIRNPNSRFFSWAKVEHVFELFKNRFNHLI